MCYNSKKVSLKAISFLWYLINWNLCENYEPTNLEVHNLTKLRIFENLKTFCYFNTTLTTNRKIYYKEKSDELFPSLGCGVFLKWIAHDAFMHHFVLSD